MSQPQFENEERLVAELDDSEIENLIEVILDAGSTYLSSITRRLGINYDVHVVGQVPGGKISPPATLANALVAKLKKDHKVRAKDVVQAIRGNPVVIPERSTNAASIPATSAPTSPNENSLCKEGKNLAAVFRKFLEKVLEVEGNAAADLFERVCKIDMSRVPFPEDNGEKLCDDYLSYFQRAYPLFIGCKSLEEVKSRRRELFADDLDTLAAAMFTYYVRSWRSRMRETPNESLQACRENMKVFLSHRGVDKDLFELVWKEFPEDRRSEVFLDVKMEAGEDNRLQMLMSVCHAKCFVALLSPAFAQSTCLLRELAIGCARFRLKQVVSVPTSGATFDEFDRAEANMKFVQLSFIGLHARSNHFESLPKWVRDAQDRATAWKNFCLAMPFPFSSAAVGVDVFEKFSSEAAEKIRQLVSLPPRRS